MPAGRPTDYTPEILEKARSYLRFFEAEDFERNVPSVADLALNLAVSRSTVYLWSKEHKEFSDILEDILSLQEKKLLVKSLNGEWNPTIAKLMLGKHGYTDRQDITTAGKELPQPLLNAISNNNSDKENP